MDEEKLNLKKSRSDIWQKVAVSLITSAIISVIAIIWATAAKINSIDGLESKLEKISISLEQIEKTIENPRDGLIVQTGKQFDDIVGILDREEIRDKKLEKIQSDITEILIILSHLGNL